MNTPVSPAIYCNNLTAYSRYQTREVNVGGLIIGGSHPIRVQSMTTTDTMNTQATVEQSIRMINAGSELVRITAPSINEAQNLAEIKKILHSKGFRVPLVADIHFTPNAAELAARLVEKVRVNPGNYADKKKFENITYNDDTYAAELDRIRQRFTPLVKICKEYGTAMRIGTNHGSLSDRIMSRYGDTPLGMVESALEFLRISEDLGYYNIVLSMKSSNPQVMVQAYRLLIQRMTLEGMNYPLHLGVTEAGEGEDGRIKSAVGIGALLEDGIGDTIRVSLTEDPEFEIPVAKALVARYDMRAREQKFIPELTEEEFNTITATADNGNSNWSPVQYDRRKTVEHVNLGGQKPAVVIADLSRLEKITHDSLIPFGYRYSSRLDKWNLSDQAVDFIYTGRLPVDFEIPGTLSVISDAANWKSNKERNYPLFSFEAYEKADNKSPKLNFVSAGINDLQAIGRMAGNMDSSCVLILSTDNAHGMSEQRRIFFELLLNNINIPVLIKRSYSGSDAEEVALHASTDIGALLLDGFGDGIWLDAPQLSPEFLNRTSFGILQATRTRISKTEYISCPSCGRTLFDLQETTAQIRKRTSHLKGLKIGIMGCIVNGPGEMADADYGYVGTGIGKITLYKGREVVQRNIDSAAAVDALIDLIKKNGDWVEGAE